MDSEHYNIRDARTGGLLAETGRHCSLRLSSQCRIYFEYSPPILSIICRGKKQCGESGPASTKEAIHTKTKEDTPNGIRTHVST
jgi:hypothetical protein